MDNLKNIHIAELKEAFDEFDKVCDDLFHVDQMSK